MQTHNDIKATEVSTYAGTHGLTTTTGERRAVWEDAPARRLVRSRVRWLWLAGLLLTVLVGTPSAFAIPVCGDKICQPTPPGFPPDCDCGSGPPPEPSCTNECENGACDQPASGVNKDYDGVPDRLEYDLAHKFFPDLWLQTFDHDLNASYLYYHSALPYMVTPYNGPETLCDEAYECLEIRYGMAFFEDYGLPVTVCSPLWPWCYTVVVGEHGGDSEFYAALVRRTTPYSTAHTDLASWQLIRDFTAAHQGAIGDSSRLGVYGSGAVSCPVVWGQYAHTPLSSRATVFASGRKHGLYHTIDECEWGALATDWCDSSTATMYNLHDYKAANLLQNIGNATFSTSFDGTIQDCDGCGAYAIWSGAEFGGASPYDEKFLDPINWCLPPLVAFPDIYETIPILPAALPVGTLGMDYGQTFDPVGSTGAVEWSLSAGTVPSGVTLDARSGALAGTPTVPGTSTFTVRAANSTSLGERTYTLVVKGTSATELLAFPNPVEAGQLLTLEAEVRTQNGDRPTGTVYFGMSSLSTVKGEILGTATLDGGVAHLTIAAPAAGIKGETVEYVISAYYSSDGYFYPSSADISLIVHAESAPIE